MKDIPISPRLIEEKKKRRKRLVRISILFFVLFVIVIFGASYFSSYKKIIIKDISVNGAKVVNQDEIISFVKGKLSGKYLYLFSRANSFIYPKEEIYDGLLFNFPRIESLSIEKDGFNKIQINLTERVGTYLYCGESVPQEKKEIGENCYFINDDGYLFDKAPYYSGDIYFKYYLKTNSGELLGTNILPKDNFVNLTRFINSVKSLGFSPIYIVMGEDETNYLYLEHNEGETSPYIIFKDNDDLVSLIDDFTVSLREKEFKDELESNYGKLIYLDLRFKNKILYKFEK